ncbi:MAG: hypothetical protein DRO06_02220, partial [Thermoproteota archaeon]
RGRGPFSERDLKILLAIGEEVEELLGAERAKAYSKLLSRRVGGVYSELCEEGEWKIALALGLINGVFSIPGWPGEVWKRSLERAVKKYGDEEFAAALRLLKGKRKGASLRGLGDLFRSAPRYFRERSRYFAISAVFVLIGGLLGTTWVGEVLVSFMKESFGPVEGVSGWELAWIIYANNVRVSAILVGGGPSLYVAPAVLAVNGMVVGGFLSFYEAEEPVYHYIAPHGILEVSCILLSASAGLSTAVKLIRGGNLRKEGEASVSLFLASTVWLMLSAVVESFVTESVVGRAELPIVVGVILAAPFYVWLAVGGRGR